jgi:hypothetical protein
MGAVEESRLQQAAARPVASPESEIRRAGCQDAEISAIPIETITTPAQRMGVTRSCSM